MTLRNENGDSGHGPVCNHNSFHNFTYHQNIRVDLMQFGQEEAQKGAFGRRNLHDPILSKINTGSVCVKGHDRAHADRYRGVMSHETHLLLNRFFEVVGVDAVCGLAHHLNRKAYTQ